MHLAVYMEYAPRPSQIPGWRGATDFARGVTGPCNVQILTHDATTVTPARHVYGVTLMIEN